MPATPFNTLDNLSLHQGKCSLGFCLPAHEMYRTLLCMKRTFSLQMTSIKRKQTKKPTGPIWNLDNITEELTPLLFLFYSFLLYLFIILFHVWMSAILVAKRVSQIGDGSFLLGKHHSGRTSCRKPCCLDNLFGAEDDILSGGGGRGRGFY